MNGANAVSRLAREAFEAGWQAAESGGHRDATDFAATHTLTAEAIAAFVREWYEAGYDCLREREQQQQWRR